MYIARLSGYPRKKLLILFSRYSSKREFIFCLYRFRTIVGAPKIVKLLFRSSYCWCAWYLSVDRKLKQKFCLFFAANTVIKVVGKKCQRDGDKQCNEEEYGKYEFF